MKKIISGILVFIMVAAFGISAFAATEYPFYSEELKLTLSVSDEYSIITKNTPASDPVFERIGISKAEYDSYALSSNVYFFALDVNWEEEINIMMSDVSSLVPENDFSLLDSSTVEGIYANIKTAIEQKGGTASNYEIYRTVEATYMKVFGTYYMDDVYDLMYYTIIDGKEYYFLLSSYLGEVTPEQELFFLNFINNVNFDNAPVISEPVVEETVPEVEVTEEYFNDEFYDDEYYDDSDYYEDEYEYEESNKGMPWWGWLLIALGICALIGIPVVIIIVVIIIIVVVKKKKKKKAAAAQNTANPQ